MACTFSEDVCTTGAEGAGSDWLGSSSVCVGVGSSGVWVVALRCRAAP